mmetsp:Transcript_101850/g.263227  ORF Transcript_101850/g.263227 Transcript_101850/m.263227 type:complete len:232 (+) Transcript_101850:911-1606(+)
MYLHSDSLRHFCLHTLMSSASAGTPLAYMPVAGQEPLPIRVKVSGAALKPCFAMQWSMAPGRLAAGFTGIVLTPVQHCGPSGPLCSYTACRHMGSLRHFWKHSSGSMGAPQCDMPEALPALPPSLKFTQYPGAMVSASAGGVLPPGMPPNVMHAGVLSRAMRISHFCTDPNVRLMLMSPWWFSKYWPLAPWRYTLPSPASRSLQSSAAPWLLATSVVPPVSVRNMPLWLLM